MLKVRGGNFVPLRKRAKSRVYVIEVTIDDIYNKEYELHPSHQKTYIHLIKVHSPALAAVALEATVLLLKLAFIQQNKIQ